VVAGRLGVLGWVLLAAGMACGGCEQVDPLRQGLQHSSYQQEMRQLADEVSRKGLAKDLDRADQSAAVEGTATEEVVQAAHWESPSLLNAVHLRPPVPFDSGSLDPP
jgi:hypothetical protein